jgi:NitT/TauT family transport system permease protein
MSDEAGATMTAPVRTSRSAAVLARARNVIVAPAIGAAVILLVWYLVIWLMQLSAFLLPRPHQIAKAVVTNWSYLLAQSWTTTLETVLGLTAGVVIAVIVAALIAEIEPLARAVLPWLIVSQAVPKVAIAPLFLIWFGFDLAPKVVIGFFIAVFPIIISTASGLTSITVEEQDLFRTMTPSHWHLYRHLKIPRALPQFFDGLKVATALALVGAVVGEFVSSHAGLGYVIMVANRDLDTNLMFAAFVALSVVGLLLFYGAVALERLLIPWYFAQRRGGGAP